MKNEINMKGKIKMESYDDCSNRIEEWFSNLYLHEGDGRIKLYISTAEERERIPSLFRDKDTGNVHMIPDDLNLAELCSAYIRDKGNDILEHVKEIISKNRRYQNKNISCKPEDLPHGSIFNNTDSKICNFLFSYVGVICNNTKYDLVFNRFYFDESKKVNCILLCPQIEMYEKSLRGSKMRDVPPKTKNYPNTSDDNQWNEDHTYYNFGVDLYSPSENIARAFLNFVIATEKKKQVDGNV